METRPYAKFQLFKHKSREKGDGSLTKIVKIYQNTKIVKTDTVPYIKIAKIDTLSGGTSPVPKLYIVHPPGNLLFICSTLGTFAPAVEETWNTLAVFKSH